MAALYAPATRASIIVCVLLASAALVAILVQKGCARASPEAQIQSPTVEEEVPLEFLVPTPERTEVRQDPDMVARPRAVRVRVEHNGQAVPDAHVELESDVGARVELQHRGEGVFVGELPISGDFRLNARAHGFVPTFRRIAQASEEIDVGIINLEQGVLVTGRVKRPDGQPVPSGVRLIACPHVLDIETVETSPYTQSVAVDEHGAYAIYVKPATTYFLTAGGSGWAAPSAAFLPADADPISGLDIDIWRLVSVGVRVRDDATREPVSMKTFSGVVVEAQGTSSASSFDAYLAGFVGHSEECWIIKRLTPNEQSVEARAEFVVPGYRDAVAKLRLQPTTDVLPVVRVDMERIASGFGSVDVRIASDIAPEIGLQPAQSGLSLCLKPLYVAGLDNEVCQELPSLSAQTVALQSIPAGRYEVSVKGFGEVLASSVLEVANGETATWTWDARQRGALRLVVNKPYGYAEGLRVTLDGAYGKSEVVFLKPPYRIDGVGLGQVRVNVVSMQVGESGLWEHDKKFEGFASIEHGVVELAIDLEPK